MLELSWSSSGLAAMISAGFLGIFSIVVGALGRFRGPSRWYALFGGAFATTIVLGGFAGAIIRAAQGDLAGAAHTLVRGLIVAQGVLGLAWFYGVIRLLDEYGGRPYRWIGWLGIGIFVALGSPALIDGWRAMDTRSFAVVAYFATIARNLPIYWMGAAPLILALARLKRPQSGQAILAAAMAAYPLAWLAYSGVRAIIGGFLTTWLALYPLVVFAALAAGWLVVQERCKGRAPLAVLATGGIFLALGVLLGLYTDFSPSSIARTFDVLLVAYAVLRLQYLGLDIKVRWGISKSTVAAIFVAVIFLASEGAQLVFGDGNEWLGLAAGAALVFFLAPLGRFADRVAERAVPVATVGDAQARYRRHAAVAWADGSISAKEMRMLQLLRDELGISPGDAEAIQRDVQGGAV